MPAIVKCDQCGKTESEAVMTRAETEPHWVENREAHPGPHGGEHNCWEYHLLFCGWPCLATYATAKTLMGKIGE